MDPVVHFEIPYENQERIAKFYEEAFGWRMQRLGEPMEIPGIGRYVSFLDTERNRSSMLQPAPTMEMTS